MRCRNEFHENIDDYLDVDAENIESVDNEEDGVFDSDIAWLEQFDDEEDAWNPEQVDDMLDWESDTELLEGWVWVDDDDDDSEHYTLVGQDGNIFNLIGCVMRWMREVGCDNAERERFRNEVQAQHSYEDALALCVQYTDLCNELYAKKKSHSED